MSIQISIIMACRLDDNVNSQLKKCLSSLVDKAYDTRNFEVLIKLDDNDGELDTLQEIIRQFSEIISIKVIITPRGAGYGDLHKAYNDLLCLADPATAMYWCISDDMVIYKKNWDYHLIQASRKFPDGIFVINTNKCIEYATPRDSVKSPDAYPCWSAKWIGMQGGFGYLLAIDSWTSLLCHNLRTVYDRRIFVDMQIERKIGPEDVEGSELWNKRRKPYAHIHDLLLSPQLQRLLNFTALNFINTERSFTSNPSCGQKRRTWFRTFRSKTWFLRPA